MQPLHKVLNKAEYALIMPQYAKICLNNVECDDMMVYADISGKAVQNSECV